jgi:hypothetical protein
MTSEHDEPHPILPVPSLLQPGDVLYANTNVGSFRAVVDEAGNVGPWEAFDGLG